MEQYQAVNSTFYDVKQVCAILGVGKSKGYAVIKQLNEELSKEGFITIQGKVSKRYFEERVCL